jgi:hypothetical protein
MTKNEIIDKIVTGLIKQREILVNEITMMSFGEMSQMDKKQALEMQLGNIDMELGTHVMNSEILLTE